jgi:LuxR family transcriptional regulator, maltose regulon positive regulatory protein
MPGTKNSRRQAAIDARPLDHYQAHYSRAKAAQPGQFNDHQMRAHGANGMIEGVGSPSGLHQAGNGRGRDIGGVVPRAALFERLGSAARVTVVSAPAGSGKTVLLRSWIAEAGLAGRAAWVAAGRGERDPQRFWLSVFGALRQTGPGTGPVRAVSAAPDLDGWALAEGLLSDLAPLDERLWLVIDDVHELHPDALRQLQLLIMRAPPELRFVLTARHDVQLGLHRLRLDGGLTEIRAGDLKFTLAEAGELFTAAGVELDEPTLAVLHARTEGWAAGLRLAALSLARHPDPARFAAGFSGTDRTVADYLLAEVLDRQPAAVRRLLLRTSILERVNGELANLLTGDEGGERVLQDLEAAGAFTVSLDGSRSWFRYHQMFAALLRLELRRAEPGAVTGLHAAAAGWLAAEGFAVEAVRQAQAARDWDLAARLLAGHWPALHLDGQAATVHELLAGFPAVTRSADAGLAVVAAADEVAQGSLEAAERYLALAERHSGSVPEDQREYGRLLLGVVRLLLDRQRGDLPAVATDVRELQAMTEVADAMRPGLGADLRALALISLGGTEFWAFAWDDAARHLEQGVALARRIGRPYLEFTGLAYQTPVMNQTRSFTRGYEVGRQAAELAERHGWIDDPAFGLASNSLGVTLAYQGRLEEAERWLQGAERTLRAEAVQPATAAAIRMSRGVLEMMRNRDSAALAAFQASELVTRWPGTSPHHLIPWIREFLLLALVRLGQTGQAGQLLDGLSDADREHGEIRIGEAKLRLATGDPRAATAALAPVLEGSAPVAWQNELAEAYVLEAIAREALGDSGAADRALERALGLAEPDGQLLPFVLHPAPGLLDRLARHGTAHAALVAEIRDMLAGPGRDGGTARGYGGGSPHPGESRPPVSRQGLGGIVAPRLPEPLLEPLSESEVRVLRYLPTNLTTPEIARELTVSPNTVRTHVRHMYAKFGTHHRAETVELARALGLLAPSRIGRATARPE